MKHTHKQVKVQMPSRWGGDVIKVDEGMVELLSAIWRHDILTLLSCQENRPGVAWIMFATPQDAASFMNIVLHFYGDAKKPWKTLYGRAMEYNCGYDRITKDWEYSISPHNRGVQETVNDEDEVITRYRGYNDFDFEVSIRFPVSDIPIIIRRLNKASVRNGA